VETNDGLRCEASEAVLDRESSAWSHFLAAVEILLLTSAVAAAIPRTAATRASEPVLTASVRASHVASILQGAGTTAPASTLRLGSGDTASAGTSTYSGTEPLRSTPSLAGVADIGAPVDTPAQAADSPVAGTLSGRTRAAPEAEAVRTSDLYQPGVARYQDPDFTACTAASTESMLNTISVDGARDGFTWKRTTSYATQESILAYERDHMTMLVTSAGTDPHGWRNALNYFGWGSLAAGVYQDAAYESFDEAARATVIALATTRKPVGILARAGGHAEFVTGYQVIGADPSTGSSDFSIVGVYLTDSLGSNGHRDVWTTYTQWRSGGEWVRFSPYLQTDSPYRDPIDGRVGRKEWYGRWVIIRPVR